MLFHFLFRIYKEHSQSLLNICLLLKQQTKNKSILQQYTSFVQTVHCLPVHQHYSENLLYLICETPLISDGKVFKGECFYAPSLTRKGEISLMQQQGALCHFDSIWRDCNGGVALQVRPLPPYVSLSVAQQGIENICVRGANQMGPCTPGAYQTKPIAYR